MSDTTKLGPPEIPNVLYVCDRLKCENCSWPLCGHTRDITHAVNFEKDDVGDLYIEKED